MQHESMFETFLKVAHTNDKQASEERQLVEAMKKLPPDVLFKIANGETKLAFMDDCVKSVGGAGGLGWVEQFKDTPFFEQALQLEQQAIQVEQMEQQHRAQRDAERDQEPKFWEMQDHIRLQKRLLGLQLAASQLQQAGAAAAPTSPGAAPPPPSTTEAAGGGAPSPTDGKVAAAQSSQKNLTQDEQTKALLLGGATGLLGARKAKEHGHDPMEGTIRGAGGTLAGVLPGALAGAYGGSRVGKHLGNPILGTQIGALLGGGLGGFTGYKALTYPMGQDKEAFDHAAELGRRMAHGDYDKAITTNAATVVGQEIAKSAGLLSAVAPVAVPGAIIGGFAGGIHGGEHDRPLEGAVRGAGGASIGAGGGGILGALGGGVVGGLGGAALGALGGGLAHGREGALAGALTGGTLGAGAGGLGGALGGAALGGLKGYNVGMKGIDRPHKAAPKQEPEEGAKVALDMGSLAGLGQKAVGFLGKNPGAAIGAAAGAAGGLAHGLQRDQQGQRHIGRGLLEGAAGAAGGAAAGHAVQNIGGAMRGGASLGQAASGYGQQLQQAGSSAMGQIRSALKPATSAAAPPMSGPPTTSTIGSIRNAPTNAGGRVAPNPPPAAL